MCGPIDCNLYRLGSCRRQFWLKMIVEMGYTLIWAELMCFLIQWYTPGSSLIELFLFRSSFLLLDRCHKLPPSNTGRIAISAISPLFVYRFARYFWFCHKDFYEEAIYDGRRFRSENARYWGVLNFKWFKRAELLWS